MKRVTLKNMHLVNFRGHKDLSIDFSERTTISGNNRLGKSTIFDAFLWALFGKDQFDRKDFEIIPVIDEKRLDKVDSEVTITIDYDGREMSLKRVYHQKWVRRRGTSEETFDGCETLYYINDVPLKSGEYKARVDLMIEETIFKLITNPSQFLSLHWTKQREILFQMAGTISDAEIAASKPEFAKLLELINGKSLSEFKKEIAARKKKLKADLDDIQPKIDQTTRLMPAEQDWSKIESDIAEIEKEIALIDAILSNHSKAVRAQYEDIQGKRKQIDELKNKQREAVNAATAKAQQDAFEANQANVGKQNEYTAARNAHLSLRSQSEQANGAVAKLESNISLKKTVLQGLRERWNTVNENEYTAKAGCLICPVFNTECSDPLATEKHAEAQETAKKSFLFTKTNDLEFINAEGVKLKGEIEELEKELAIAKEALENSEKLQREQLEKVEILKTAVESIKQVEPRPVYAQEIPEWYQLNEQIKSIEAEIEKVELNNPATDTSEHSSKKAYYNENRDRLKATLNNRDVIARYKAEIKNLESQASDLAQQIADLEGQEFTIDAFNKVKIAESESRINGMFKIVKFQLFDKTIDGNEFECCIPLNKAGVPIAVTNTAERINAGLDIIIRLSEFYNASAPIFCDGAESNNNYLNTDSQMVFLRVTLENQLTIK